MRIWIPRCVFMLLLVTPGLVQADATVTACSSDTEGPGVTLAQAMASGGAVYFQCPANTVIRVTQHYVLNSPTRLDGGGRVTLNGHGMMKGALFTAANHKLTLVRIAFKNFKVAGGGLIPVPNVSVARGSNLELDIVTVDNSESAIGAVSYGTMLAVTNSTFRGNSGTAVIGGVDTPTYIERSNFIDNGSAVLISRGEVRRTSFTNNRSGAMLVSHPTQQVIIRNCTFYQNKGDSALRMTQRSGRSGSALVSLRSNTFDGNDGQIVPGAISIYDSVAQAQPLVQPALAALPPTRFESKYDRFRNNRGGMAGAIGAELKNTQGLKITGGLFFGNRSALNGGAVAVAGGPISIGHSLFKGNSALREGSAVWSADVDVVMANSLVVENEGGAGAVNAPAATLLNVTIANNKSGGVVIRDAALASRIANSILAGNAVSNCSGVPATALTGARNTQWGAADCAGVVSADPDLDSYYIPNPGSFALTAGDPAVCRVLPVGGKDVVFSPRATNPASCALGAYEHAPLKKIPMPREIHP